jgi:hypothetical protein
MIKYKTYKLNKKLILSSPKGEVLNIHIIKFWEDVFTSIVKNGEVKHLMILCKVKYIDNNGYKTLGPLRRVGIKDLELFSEYLTDRLGILVDSYNSNVISEIVFTYVIKDGEVSSKDRLLLEDLSDKDTSFHEFNKIKLPVSMNLEDYGIIRGKTQMDENTRYFVKNNYFKRIYEIDVNLDQSINRVSVIGASDLKWIDTKLSDNSFKREIGKATLYFLEGEIILVKRTLSAMPFGRFRS